MSAAGTASARTGSMSLSTSAPATGPTGAGPPAQQQQQQQQTAPPASSTSSSSGVVMTGSMNWEPVRQRLLGPDLSDAYKAATELRENIEIVHSTEFPLMLSALLPAFSSVLANRTHATPDTTSLQHKFRHVILELISKMPANEVLRPHAPHLVAVAIDILNRDYEENALLASRIIFDLYKVYRNLPQDYVQPYIDFVIHAYRSLPVAIQRCFSLQQPQQPSASALTPAPAPAPSAQTAVVNKPEEAAQVGSTTPAAPAAAAPATTTTTTGAQPVTTPAAAVGGASLDSSMLSSTAQSPPRLSLRSNISFRVLTECPLMVMLMFQLYPKYVNGNIPVLISVMMEGLALRAPSLQSLLPPSQTKLDPNLKRLFLLRARELVAAQAKTLSFLTYLLRSFSSELKAYEDRLANNVVALMSICPREAISTRKELLVATRHLLNSDFRKGFFRHVDALLDERVLMGISSHNHRLLLTSSADDDHSLLLRPLGYTTLSDLVQHVRTMLTMPQMARVVGIFSRVLHDDSAAAASSSSSSSAAVAAASTLPMSTQYIAIRTLLSIVDIIFHNNDPNPQIGRDMLVRTLATLQKKLVSLCEPFCAVGSKLSATTQCRDRSHSEGQSTVGGGSGGGDLASTTVSTRTAPPSDSVRDIQSMIRAIIVGHKTIIYYIHNYRNQRDKDSNNKDPQQQPQRPTIPVGSNEEVSSAMLKLTSTEVAIVKQYIGTAFQAIKILHCPTTTTGSSSSHGGSSHQAEQGGSSGGGPSPSNHGTEKTLTEQHRDALTYFASAFTTLDGYNLRRTLGAKLDLLFDAIVDDPTVLVVPRHLLASNATTSYEFCSILMDFLVDHMELMSFPRNMDIVFVSNWLRPPNTTTSEDSAHKNSAKENLQLQVNRMTQRPVEDDIMLQRKSTTCLQLFERVLKSLSAFPENETVVRRHLRRIVSVCLQASMENTAAWPDSYCMLLRYVFRSISAGKFEESYKELLPLIPAVLNGLYRVVVAASISSSLERQDGKDSSPPAPALVHTAIELCLTIPARLSSLLPHMNLLLRIIVPALDSSSGDLVNLGLRTLEFWVDNLNPLFLYPEMAKEKQLFSRLMQSLSRHLRPAPYPYGLLTLRLLGKLGGKNREFLREPLLFSESYPEPLVARMEIQCHWANVDGGVEDSKNTPAIVLSVPLQRCLRTLKILALAGEPGLEQHEHHHPRNTHSRPDDETILQEWMNGCDALWNARITNVDFEAYKQGVAKGTRHTQARACLNIVGTAMESSLSKRSQDDTKSVHLTSGADQDDTLQVACTAMLFGCMIESVRDKAFAMLTTRIPSLLPSPLSESLSDFISDAPVDGESVVLNVLDFIVKLEDTAFVAPFDRGAVLDSVLSSLCAAYSSSRFSQHSVFQNAILKLVAERAGSEWSQEHELELINFAFVALKSVPRELSRATVAASSFVIRLCTLLYGSPRAFTEVENDFLWDTWPIDDTKPRKRETEPQSTLESTETPRRPGERVFRMILHDLVSMQHIVRFTARFLLVHFFLAPFSEEQNRSFLEERIQQMRRVLFSRSLRLMPLPQQVGVIEGLSIIINEVPGFLPLSDQHLLAFLSELLKMSSVADGEMTDKTLTDAVVDKNGYVSAQSDTDVDLHPSHASALFFRRECVVNIEGKRIVVPEEMPVAAQLRVSSIGLVHAVIRGQTDAFFDADTTSPIGNIRPHVVSLLFRSLVSNPARAVDAAYYALRDVLALSMVSKTTEEGEKSQSRLPKELLQTCIRPVLLQLRDYTRLSIPLLRGLSRLLSLLSSWFNKTLGEKLLDHLQKWTDPGRITSQKIWKRGDEPQVAAAIVDIFASLPHSSNFVEPLVKTCIKLEATISAFKARFVLSPYRKPLARYLNKHPQFAVSFFFQRLKTPMYSELFQDLVQLPDSDGLRAYLNDKPCSVMILNVCFERPLAIIRSEKNASSSTSSKTSLSLHGILTSPTTDPPGSSATRPMNTESLELQLQGFRLVDTLMSYNASYFQDHNDIVRALRWLWRSKGRFLRLQHEDIVSPRYHSESSFLATFLMAYAKSFPNEDLDILFELIRIFLQTATSSFSFVGRFLSETVSNVLNTTQKKQVIERFFALIAGESTEETKVLSIQFLIFPMLEAASCGGKRTDAGSVSTAEPAGASKGTGDFDVDGSLINASVVEKFAVEVIYHKGVAINCGERLKVELLRLLKLLVEANAKLIEPYRKEMVRFCWGLLKSEDVNCKGWAYLVVACFIDAFETPSKIIVQVFVALLRSHQQEGKELVRRALDLLVPVLRKRLPGEDFKRTVEQAAQLMLEEGNSTPQLAHICQTLINCPSVFYGSRNRFAGYMTSSINRLGLPPNSPLENRILSVDVVELLLDWEAKRGSGETSVIPDDQVDTLGNFLVRLKILMAEASDGRQQKVESSQTSLEIRVVNLFERVLSRWNFVVRPTPFDKAATRQNSDGVLLSCLELFTVMAKTERYAFFSAHQQLVKDIVTSAFAKSHEDARLRAGLETFFEQARFVVSLGPVMMNALEKVVLEAVTDQKEKSSAGRGSLDTSGTSRVRDRQTGSEEAAEKTNFLVFALANISRLCESRKSYFKLISNSLLSLAGVLTKNHLLEAAAKQRHGSPSTPRTTSPGIKSHTPTSGILEEVVRLGSGNAGKNNAGKHRPSKETIALGSSLTNQALVEILTILEGGDLPFVFTSSRKTFFQLINSILDGSDCVQILVIATRIAGKLIIAGQGETPVTLKEKNSFLRRMAVLSFSGISDDLESQPLADTVSQIVKRLALSGSAQPDLETSKLFVATLLHASKPTRDSVWKYLAGAETPSVALFWRVLHADFEGLGSRFWITVLVDALLLSFTKQTADAMDNLRALIHGDPLLCVELFVLLLPAAWKHVPNDSVRLKLGRTIEFMLSRPYHAQFMGNRNTLVDERCMNSVRAFLNGFLHIQPVPLLDMHLLVSLAESYNCWYEVLSLLESQYTTLKANPLGETTLSAMRHCYRKLDEEDIWMSLASHSCNAPLSVHVLSKDVYGFVNDAIDGYAELVELVESGNMKEEPSKFEMDLWEERWIDLNKDVCQLDAVSEYASSAGSPHLQLECAWKAQDWNKVRSLCSSSALLPAIEIGDPLVKMSETLLAVADGKLTDVENLHAQTAQLCLYKWQLLPRLACGSLSHSNLLHFFHRLVEIRESGQIMVETSNHSNGRTLPDLKNLLNAWRHRLPNDWERLSSWDEVFAWRAHMFTAITSNFHWSEPNTLATLHDRPWTVIRMAKTARKQGMRDVSLLLLNKTSEERAMNVSDAFLKLREQILAYYNLDSDLERHGGLNLINTTNLSFFDASQKSELFRLKALFLASLGGRSKANQAYCHSVQVSPSHAIAWTCWGELCSALGAVAEKQAEHDGASVGDAVAASEAKANAAKKVSQYLAQAMGCFLEAIHIDTHERARIHLPKCLWMLSKDISVQGILGQTLEDRGSMIPAWVWLPWTPQLLTCFYRQEGRAIKTIFSQLVRAYPQAVYYPLRSFYLERRDVERARTPNSGQQMASVTIAEVMMSLLRRSHASLWSSLESVLEELIVKFRPSYEEELLSTIIALLERAGTQVGTIGNADDEEAVVTPVWKTLGRIAVKFFRPSDSSAAKSDERATRTAEFKAEYKESFEADFDVKADGASGGKPSFGLEELLDKLRKWQQKLESHVLSTPKSLSLADSSQALAMFGLGDAPDLMPGSCDPNYSALKKEREQTAERDAGAAQSSTSSSAAAARRAASVAAKTVAEAAALEGMGGEYGGGSSRIEIPGQYAPNTSAWADTLPSPELHTKIVKFEPAVEVLRRSDQLVRRIGMVGSDGRTYRFLLQFAVPYWTRTDERTAQTHYVLDKVIRRDFRSVRAHLSVQPQPVIPVAQRLRLTCEPDGRNSLEEIHRANCAAQGIDHTALIRRYTDGVNLLMDDLKKLTGDCEEDRVKVEKDGKLKLFQSISSSKGAEPYLLTEHIRSILKDPELVFHFRRMFAQQWGANCLLQYVFSVNERNPARVAFAERDGRVLAPEFRIAYSGQGFIEKQAIPFRLTPNLVNLIGFSVMDAYFASSIARIASSVRACKSELDPTLQLLMRDDLVTFYTKSVAKSDSQTQDMEKQLGDRVSRNVATLHSRFADCSPSLAAKGETDKKTSTDPIDQKVRDLISTAQNPDDLSMMPASYQGWL